MRLTTRSLNRWTLARQHLLARAPLGVVEAVDHLGCLQAQHSPSPYIALWSRIEGFERDHLGAALRDDLVVKATLLRGTLHLVAGRRLGVWRTVAGSSYYADTLRRLEALGADVAAIRAAVALEVARAPRTRTEVYALVAERLPSRPSWVAARPSGVAAVSVATDLVNVPEDAAFGYFGGSRYRVAPVATTASHGEAFRHAVIGYLGAYGPATRADLAQWCGRPVRAFAPVLDRIDLEVFTAEDGRVLLDLPGAPRPEEDAPAPVRFLPKWDSLLLAHDRRERVLGDGHRKAVIAKNGDVAPTFLVDGVVAGMWDAPLRGTAELTLTPLRRVAARDRRAVEREGEQLLGWLRPEARSRTLTWAD